MKDYKFCIMSSSGRPKLFRSLMELRVELLELLGKRILQLAGLGRRQLLLHDVAGAYFHACVFDGFPICCRQ